MSAGPLAGARIAVLAAPLYEDIELHYPKLRLEEEGAEVIVAGYDESAYRGVFWSLALAARGRMTVPGLDARVYTGVHGMPIAADTIVEELDADAIDAVVIPGGYAADHLRRSQPVLELCSALAAPWRAGRRDLPRPVGPLQRRASAVGAAPPGTGSSVPTSRAPARPGWTSPASSTARS